LTVLDAYALVALLTDEPAAGEVEALVRGGDVAVAAVNLAEALDVAVRRHDASDDDVRSAVEPLLHADIRVVRVEEQHAWRAAELRRRHYDRRSSALSLADCFLLAAAGKGDRIATSDEPVARAAKAEGIGVAALPDSTGRRP
jgi:uncharacterized protein with PIN domain